MDCHIVTVQFLPILPHFSTSGILLRQVGTWGPLLQCLHLEKHLFLLPLAIAPSWNEALLDFLVWPHQFLLIGKAKNCGR